MSSARGAHYTLLVCAFLAIVLMCSMVWAGSHGPTQRSVTIHECALVLTRSGQECR